MSTGGQLTSFLRFGAVGASGMLVDFGSFHALRWAGLLARVDLGVLGRTPVANMLSVALAIQWNFLGNRRWTFRDRTGVSGGSAWWRFNVFSSLSWGLNVLIVGALDTHVYGGPVQIAAARIDSVNLWKLVAIGVCTLLNFFLSTRLAFRARPTRWEPGTCESLKTGIGT